MTNLSVHKRVWAAMTLWYRKLELPVIATVFLLIIAHMARIYVVDADTCTMALGSRGSGELGTSPWLSAGHWFGDEWHATGCMLEPFGRAKGSKFPACGRSQRIVFLGDSRSRNLYSAAINWLDPKAESEIFPDSHANLNFSANGVSLEFYWLPEVADHNVISMYSAWRDHRETAPDVIVHTAGLWALKRSESTGAISNDFDVLLNEMFKLTTATEIPIYWVPQGPVDEPLLREDRKAITNARISKLNEDINDAVRMHPHSGREETRIFVVNAVLEIVQTSDKKFPDSDSDGLHYSRTVNRAQLELIMNSFCHRFNPAYVPQSSASCCVPPPPISLTQQLALAILGVFVILHLKRKNILTASEAPVTNNAVVPEPIEPLLQSPKAAPVANASTIVRDLEETALNPAVPTVSGAEEVAPIPAEVTDVKVVVPKANSEPLLPVAARSPKPKRNEWEVLFENMAVVAVLMGFMFICDRTSLFLKETKEFSWTWFVLPNLVLLAAGLLTLKEASSEAFLNRDQTDEWKGWMQLAILVYHFTGASAVLPIYVFIRVCVASYLFMTGYGHFLFFEAKGDFGFIRFAQVMLRVNIFVIFLCLVMGGGYQDYYFVPLSSFWFLVVYATMVFMSAHNASPYLLLAKVLGSLALCFMLWLEIEQEYPVFDLVFNIPPLFWVFEINGSVTEWRFRSGLDRYATGFGMLLALAYICGKRNGYVKDSEGFSLFSSVVSKVCVALSAGAFAAYLYFSNSCPNKPDCNDAHVHLSLALIFAFVLLRNTFACVRKYYSQFFAASGRISLELFLAQYHMFLANDTAGVLVLIPGMPIVNFVLVSVIFMYVANAFSEAFNALVGFFVVKDLTVTYYRLGILAAVVAVLRAIYQTY